MSELEPMRVESSRGPDLATASAMICSGFAPVTRWMISQVCLTIFCAICFLPLLRPWNIIAVMRRSTIGHYNTQHTRASANTKAQTAGTQAHRIRHDQRSIDQPLRCARALACSPCIPFVDAFRVQRETTGRRALPALPCGGATCGAPRRAACHPVWSVLQASGLICRVSAAAVRVVFRPEPCGTTWPGSGRRCAAATRRTCPSRR